MYTIKNKITAALVLLAFLAFSCKNLADMNINPNGSDPANTSPNFLMATVITSTGGNVINMGFGDIAGVMQHTQLNGWASGHNQYDWNDQSWAGSYGTLRNVEEMLIKSKAAKLDFQAGVAMVFKAYNFGIIADLWGDAPFTQALKGEQGSDYFKPAFDTQRDIYLGVIAMLDSANTLFSKPTADYKEINPSQDVLYAGNAAKWRKFTNSLALRYFLRISSKEPALAKLGIEKITGSPAKYPLILDQSDDAGYNFIGLSPADSWPTTTQFSSDLSNFTRVQMCSTLVEKLESLNDPRLRVWAAKVKTPLVVDPSKPDDYDEIVNGKRVISQKIASDFETSYNVKLNLDQNYVGLPPAWSTFMFFYNLNPSQMQGSANPHVSQLADMYSTSSGSLLKVRLLSASEVHLGLAEIALKGWNAGGTASDHYKAGVKASLQAWGVGGDYDSYIANVGVAFNNSLGQILEQKWIASWSAATESWLDYIRTGLPNLKAGPASRRPVLPLRFTYGNNETLYNPDNSKTAIGKLEATTYSVEGKNSNWSKNWLQQGTGKPW
ncbi:MAG: SusD/RagB family nutrient-binding outer membrane lipoprotein [Mariniphaga sp.]